MSSVTKALFDAIPSIIYVDEDNNVKPPSYGTIEKLMSSLQENGPLIAVGQMGPSAYTEPPFKLKNKEVYGWKSDTRRQRSCLQNVILLRAQRDKSTDNGYVYFTLAQDVTQNKNILIRGYSPLEADKKIYVMTYKNFLNNSLNNLHPICPWGQWLYSVNSDSILDKGETEEKCKAIGQKIFDHYKRAADNNYEAGRNALVRICNAARFLTRDGSKRKAHIERAWDGVGDTNWNWRS